MLFKRNHGLKYKFVIRPGGNSNDIKINWQNTSASLKNGEIEYLNKLGFIRESRLVSYGYVNLLGQKLARPNRLKKR